MKLVCFGDSTTRGTGDPDFGGWVSHVRKHVEGNNPRDKVYNCGVSGQSSTEVLHRFEFEAKARNATDVIVFVGIKDACSADADLVPVTSKKDFTVNLLRFIDVASENEWNISFIGLYDLIDENLQPHPRTGTYFSNASVREYDALIESVCQSAGTSYVSLRGVMTKEDIIDAIHPGPGGYVKIANAVIQMLGL